MLKRNFKKRVGTWLTALMAFAAFSGASAQHEILDETLVIAQPSPFQFTDPQRTYLSSEAATWSSMYDSLLFRRSDLSIAPGLATSYQQVDDSTWELELRDDVTFHNGEPFNAETVKWNVERVIVPGFQDYAFLSPLAGAEVVDEYTVRIFTNEILPTFPGLMTTFMMVPSDYIEENGVEVFTQAPVGTGPYKFVGWDPGTYFEVTANEDYWGTERAPTFRNVRWRVIPESGSRLAALVTGEVDIVKDVPADDYDRIAADPGLEALWVRSLRTPYIGFYPDSPKTGAEPMADLRVRQAINHAVNVDLIIEALLGGRAFRTATLMTPDFSGYRDIEPYTYDPELAKQLLADAGYPEGFDVTFETWSAGPAPRPVDVVQVLAEQLSAVGIRATVVPTDVATAFSYQLGGTLAPLFLWSWGASGIDCIDKHWGVFHPDSSASMMTTDELTTGIEQLQQTVPQDERDALCGELQQMVHDNALIIPLFAQGDTYAIRNGLEWTPRSDELILPWEVSPK